MPASTYLSMPVSTHSGMPASTHSSMPAPTRLSQHASTHLSMLASTHLSVPASTHVSMSASTHLIMLASTQQSMSASTHFVCQCPSSHRFRSCSLSSGELGKQLMRGLGSAQRRDGETAGGHEIPRILFRENLDNISSIKYHASVAAALRC